MHTPGTEEDPDPASNINEINIFTLSHGATSDNIAELCAQGIEVDKSLQLPGHEKNLGPVHAEETQMLPTQKVGLLQSRGRQLVRWTSLPSFACVSLSLFSVR